MNILQTLFDNISSAVDDYHSRQSKKLPKLKTHLDLSLTGYQTDSNQINNQAKIQSNQLSLITKNFSKINLASLQVSSIKGALLGQLPKGQQQNPQNPGSLPDFLVNSAYIWNNHGPQDLPWSTPYYNSVFQVLSASTFAGVWTDPPPQSWYPATDHWNDRNSYIASSTVTVNIPVTTLDLIVNGLGQNPPSGGTFTPSNCGLVINANLNCNNATFYFSKCKLLSGTFTINGNLLFAAGSNLTTLVNAIDSGSVAIDATGSITFNVDATGTSGLYQFNDASRLSNIIYNATITCTGMTAGLHSDIEFMNTTVNSPGSSFHGKTSISNDLLNVVQGATSFVGGFSTIDNCFLSLMSSYCATVSATGELNINKITFQFQDFNATDITVVRYDFAFGNPVVCPLGSFDISGPLTKKYRFYIVFNTTNTQASLLRGCNVIGDCSIAMSGIGIQAVDSYGNNFTCQSDAQGNYSMFNSADSSTWKLCPGDVSVTCNPPAGFNVGPPATRVININPGGFNGADFVVSPNP